MAPAGKFSDPRDLHKYNQELQVALKRIDTVFDGNRHLRRTRKSIDGVKEILRRIGNPEKNLSAVHITGSKGKGSVAALITAGLLEATFLKQAVGTFMGPHVLRVNERIQCNGCHISDTTFANSLNRAMDVVESYPPVQNVAHYDLMAATGFDAMSRTGCKWAVVEVVIGGRLDVTNVLSAPVVVITNIYLEHTDIIGPSLENIAREKAGIITAGADVICGMRKDDPLASIFIEEANLHSPPARVFFLPERQGSSLFERNVALARAALERVARRYDVKLADGKKLLPMGTAREAMAAIPGRQETFRLGKWKTPIVLDGAHVAESLGAVIDEMLMAHPGRNLAVVLTIGMDKDVESICSAISRRNPVWIITTDLGRGREGNFFPASDLKDVLVGMDVECVEDIENMQLAFAKLLDLAGVANMCVLCTGTMKIIAEMRPLLIEECNHE